MSNKGTTLNARDRAISELQQAMKEKTKAISLQNSAIVDRREVVERIEELHLKVVELTKELSQVPELQDSSWVVGFNWGFEHYQGVARSAPW